MDNKADMLEMPLGSFRNQAISIPWQWVPYTSLAKMRCHR